MYYLRSAVNDDIDLIYKWANDPLVRINSFNSEPILYKKHVHWFESMMNDSSILQFVFMDDDTPIGQIRLNISEDEAEIGYSIAAEHRGKGLGHKLLQLVKEEVSENHPEINRLVAKVKPDNGASNRLFESEGYEVSYSCYVTKI